ncbi:class III extradiol dioxygenase family protein [Lapillicoccus sp.]|uniref:class III extradiol dioxygenase family protein n=1 Tax=Lapillicoccus sp. TaxID=1909287 RepID=UPI0025F971DE|nr:class III extradiol dioxygenase family protein [Lapillicoccus sp.]
MAHLLAGLGTSHVPSIGVALDRGQQQSPEWKAFFDGYEPAQQWVRDNRPDVAVVVFNDHYNAMFLDRVPTFAVGCAATYAPVDEGWGPRAIPTFEGHPDFSWFLVDALVDNKFDPEIIQEIKVDHGLQVPLELFWGRPADRWPVKVVPIFVNVLQFPIPRPDRLYELGHALGAAIRAYDSEERFVVLGTGGLSHQLQGSRAGFTNPEADRAFLHDIATDPTKLAGWTREQYVETFGGEGAEVIMWLVMRGALDDVVTVLFDHYFVPASMTGAGMIGLQNTLR